MRHPPTPRDADAALYAELTGRLAANVQRLRAARAWTQEQAAARCLLSFRAYHGIEQARANFTARAVALLARGYGVGLDDLLRPAAAPPPRGPGRPRTAGAGAPPPPKGRPPGRTPRR